MLLLVLLAAFSSCHVWCALARSQNCAQPVSCDPATDYFSAHTRIAIEYAIETIRDVAFFNTYVDFTGRGLGPDELYNYRIVVCGCPLPPNSQDRIVLYSHPNSLYINESPSLALLHFLQPTVQSLSYVNTGAYIYTPAIRESIARNEVKQITDSNFVTDYSILSNDDSLSGSLIGTFTASEYLNHAKNIPFIVVAESSETSPLARAEWMKIIGLYLGLSDKANDRFDKVVRQYNDAKDKALHALRRPSVLLNYPTAKAQIDLSLSPDHNYNWFLPHRDQYTTHLLNDANAAYRYANVDSETSLQSSISQVVKHFGSARYLVLAGTFPADAQRDTLEEFMNSVVSPLQPDANARSQFLKLSSVRCANVWGREKRISDDGNANDFFESGVFQPDEILKDLVSILHPNVQFGQRQTYYMHHYKPTSSKYTSDCPFNDLRSKPVSGELHIDTFFSVSQLDRFQIEDLWETKILPNLNEIEQSAAYDMLFKAEPIDSNSTLFTLRAQVKRGREGALDDPELLRKALEKSLGTEVKLRNGDETDKPKRSWLRRNVFAVIIIPVFIIPGVIVFCVRKRRQKKNKNNFKIERIPGAKLETWSELEEGGVAYDVERPQ